jgi:hypothetical protein
MVGYRKSASPLFERIVVTFAMLQSPDLVISQQRQEVLNLRTW